MANQKGDTIIPKSVADETLEYVSKVKILLDNLQHAVSDLEELGYVVNIEIDSSSVNRQ